MTTCEKHGPRWAWRTLYAGSPVNPLALGGSGPTIGCHITSGWWLTYPSETMKVNGKDDIPYMKWKIQMIETTNQTFCVLISHFLSVKTQYSALKFLASAVKAHGLGHVLRSYGSTHIFVDQPTCRGLQPLRMAKLGDSLTSKPVSTCPGKIENKPPEKWLKVYESIMNRF